VYTRHVIMIRKVIIKTAVCLVAKKWLGLVRFEPSK
jgi:hypothetical protein